MYIGQLQVKVCRSAGLQLKVQVQGQAQEAPPSLCVGLHPEIPTCVDYKAASNAS